MISVEQAGKSFGSRSIWSDISFTVESGQLLALVGPSGCGKSTLLNCLGLLDHVDDGTITVDGAVVSAYKNRRRRLFRRHQLGYLFQNYALIENATVRYNLDVVSSTGMGAFQPGRSAYGASLDRVGMAGRENEMVYRLSGGEQQRVALARLIVKKPSVVLADEPTGALDPANADLVIDVLRELGAAGCSVVIATHNVEVERRCDARLRLGP